jgi:hypothetical protein
LVIATLISIETRNQLIDNKKYEIVTWLCCRQVAMDKLDPKLIVGDHETMIL